MHMPWRRGSSHFFIAPGQAPLRDGEKERAREMEGKREREREREMEGEDGTGGCGDRR